MMRGTGHVKILVLLILLALEKKLEVRLTKTQRETTRHRTKLTNEHNGYLVPMYICTYMCVHSFITL